MVTSKNVIFVSNTTVKGVKVKGNISFIFEISFIGPESRAGSERLLFHQPSSRNRIILFDLKINLRGALIFISAIKAALILLGVKAVWMRTVYDWLLTIYYCFDQLTLII